MSIVLLLHTFTEIYYVKKLLRNLKLSLLIVLIICSGISVAIPILCHVYCRIKQMNKHILKLFLTRILTVEEQRSKHTMGGEKNTEKTCGTGLELQTVGVFK